MAGERKGSLELFKVAGVQVEIDYSWIVIAMLVWWSLSAGYFPRTYPGHAFTSYWIVGAIGTVLFFASVLGHELSHAALGNRLGENVSRITLFIFGGMAHLSGEPKTAGDEFKIAAIGPVSSVVIAAIFWTHRADAHRAARAVAVGRGFQLPRVHQCGARGVQSAARLPARRRPYPARDPMALLGRLPARHCGRRRLGKYHRMGTDRARRARDLRRRIGGRHLDDIHRFVPARRRERQLSERRDRADAGPRQRRRFDDSRTGHDRSRLLGQRRCRSLFPAPRLHRFSGGERRPRDGNPLALRGCANVRARSARTAACTTSWFRSARR